MVNVAPHALPSLVAATRPPCSSVRWRTSDSPIPRPACVRVTLETSWLKRSNTCGRNSGAIPSPESLIVTRASPPTASIPTSTAPRGGVNLSELDSRFQNTCWSRR